MTYPYDETTGGDPNYFNYYYRGPSYNPFDVPAPGYYPVGRVDYSYEVPNPTRVRPTVTKRGPEKQLEGLKAFIGEDGTFQWSKPPGTGVRGRGLYPTALHVMAWYKGALDYGFDIEDIGFTPQDLFDAWHDYVVTTWPGDPRNDTPMPTSFIHTMPWQESHVFPNP